MPTAETSSVDMRIVFYCKDCQRIVDANKLPTRYVYRCGPCGTKNVAFGTEKSIRSYYHVKDEAPEPAKKKPDAENS